MHHRPLTLGEKDCLKYKGLCPCAESDQPVAGKGKSGSGGKGGPAFASGGDSYRTGEPLVLLPPCGPEEAERRREREARRLALKAEKMAQDKPPEKPLKPCWPGLKGPLKGRRM